METSTVVATKTSGRVNVGVGVLAAVALIAAIAFGIVALQKGSQNLSRIYSLEAQVRLLSAHTGGAQATVTSRLATAESKLTALEAKAAASTAKQAKAEGSLAKLVSCVPELQTEVGDLEIAGETYSVAHLKNGTNISKECTSILYGTTGG
jgi:hypothetical protein